MANQVNTFRDLAAQFQQAKTAAGATEPGAAFSAARGELKGAFASYRVEKGGVDVKDAAERFFKNESAQEKASRKMNEWLKKPLEQEEKADGKAEERFASAAVQFEAAFLACTKSEELMAARAAKKAFKAETFAQLKAGKSVEELQKELDGLSLKTVSKVAYWSSKLKA